MALPTTPVLLPGGKAFIFDGKFSTDADDCCCDIPLDDCPCDACESPFFVTLVTGLCLCGIIPGPIFDFSDCGDTYTLIGPTCFARDETKDPCELIPIRKCSALIHCVDGVGSTPKDWRLLITTGSEACEYRKGITSQSKCPTGVYSLVHLLPECTNCSLTVTVFS